MIRLEIKTQKPIEVEESFKKMIEIIDSRAKGALVSTLQKKDDKFYVTFDFLTSNKFTNWIIIKEFKKGFKKIDNKIKIKVLKDSTLEIDENH